MKRLGEILIKGGPGCWFVVAIFALIVVLVYGAVFYGIKVDGENARRLKDAHNRTVCAEEYATPECLQVRLKQAELRQQYEEGLNALKTN
jgi:hypothetical protein